MPQHGCAHARESASDRGADDPRSAPRARSRRRVPAREREAEAVEQEIGDHDRRDQRQDEERLPVALEPCRLLARGGGRTHSRLRRAPRLRPDPCRRRTRRRVHPGRRTTRRSRCTISCSLRASKARNPPKITACMIPGLRSPRIMRACRKPFSSSSLSRARGSFQRTSGFSATTIASLRHAR